MFSKMAKINVNEVISFSYASLYYNFQKELYVVKLNLTLPWRMFDIALEYLK